MKSLHAADTTSNRFTRNHWFLTILGVIIAIVGSFVLLTDAQPNSDERKQSVYIDAPTSPISGQFVNVTKIHLLSKVTMMK